MQNDRNDVISRQAAIDALSTPHGILYPIRTVEELPSAQPEMNLDEWCTDCKEYDHEKHCCPRWNRVIRQTLSEQPEIIRCKDCRFQDKGLNESESWNLCGYRPWLHVPTEDENYCGYAERRTDE